MANFDLDDPLGDLLSDGSNDSFFEEPKVLAKRSSLTKTPEKKSVSDLFGLEEGSKNKKDDWLGLGNKNETLPRREKSAKKISFEEDDDILNTLGLDNTKAKESKKPESAKKSLMDSILGQPKEDEKKFLSLDDLLKESKAKKPDPTEMSQSTSHLTQKPESPFGLSSLEGPREGRRGRPKTATLPDPLGLFSSETKPEPKPEPKPRKKEPEPETEIVYQNPEIKSSTSLSDVPDWLGGNLRQNKSDSSVDKIVQRDNPRKDIERIVEVPNVAVKPSEESQINIDSLMTQQKLATSHFEYQNSSIALQQQESQVLMALQLRKYEENLSDIQRKQQEVIMKQEQQFNNLLERQFAKQQIMENNMRLQQERINGHIQMLISQPPVSAVRNPEEEKLVELRKSTCEETTKHFDEIINSLKQRQHEEMFLLEESYKKQLSTLEQSMESMENHLKMELDSVTMKFREKLELAEGDHGAEIAKYKKKLEDLHQLHESEMKQMRENNNRVLEEIKYEYNTIIENIKRSKQTEQAAMQDVTSYSQKLESNLKMLDINSRTLLEVKNKVDSDYSVLSLAREESLKAKEEEIKLMRLALEKAREAADTERSQLMALVRNLELKLVEQTQNSREERFALQQAASTLTARTTALDREAEFNRASLDREREQLKTLRESILAEQEKAIQQITEEKLLLQSEKVRLETSAKLNQSYDSQRAKAEMDAAMQVAKEAAELTDRERDNLLRQLREVESLKRNLLDREKKISGKENELASAMEQANRKILIGERALEEARMLQMNYNDRLREIQAQVSSLAARERKLAEEKISVSKERLSLHNSARQIKRCGLCAIDNIQKVEDDDNISEDVEHDIPRFITVSDADMFRLQLQMSEDQLTSVRAEDRLSLH